MTLSGWSFGGPMMTSGSSRVRCRVFPHLPAQWYSIPRAGLWSLCCCCCWDCCKINLSTCRQGSRQVDVVGMCTRASAKRMTRTHGGHDGGGWCVGGVRRAVLHEVKIGVFATVLICGKDTWFVNIFE